MIPCDLLLTSTPFRHIIQCMLNYVPGSNESPSPPTDLHTLAMHMKALADPNRLLILHMLMEGVQCNCELGDALGMPPNLISHHLHILRDAGLVDVEHDVLDARWVYYSIKQETLFDWITDFREFFNLQRIKPRRASSGPRGALVQE